MNSPEKPTSRTTGIGHIFQAIDGLEALNTSNFEDIKRRCDGLRRMVQDLSGRGSLVSSEDTGGKSDKTKAFEVFGERGWKSYDEFSSYKLSKGKDILENIFNNRLTGTYKFPQIDIWAKEYFQTKGGSQ